MAKKIATKFYEPEGYTKACMVVLHGMQEHQLRYMKFAKRLQAAGIAVMTYDLPGHGQSVTEDSPYGYFGEEYGWDALVNSAVEAVNEMKRRHPGVPVWLFGHSMGTIIARCFLQDNDKLIDGLILSGMPHYTIAVKPGLIAAKIIRKKEGAAAPSETLNKLLTGSFNKAIKNPRTEVDWLSVNQQNIENYIADPMCGVPFTTQGYIDLLEGMEMMNTKEYYQCENPRLVIRCYAGEQDPCTGGRRGFSSSVRFLKIVGYKNVRTTVYPGVRHELLQEEVGTEMTLSIIDRVLKAQRS